MATAGSMPSLESLLSSVNSSTFKQAARSAYSDFMGFYHAVDWAEPWLLGLGAFHLFIWILAIATYRWNDFQMVLLTLTLASVYCAEYINDFAGRHWEDFAGQNYFDKNGVFVSVMFSAPLLVVAVFMLLNALRAASKLLIAVKTQELKAKRRKKATKAE